MAKTWYQGKFTPKNPEKYVGRTPIALRSSWEFTMAAFCDNNPSVIGWAVESLRIPYMNPITRKQTTYVPDFLIIYIDKKSQKHAEVIEIKPLNQTTLEHAGKSRRNQAAAIINQAKWAACNKYCRANGLVFRIITENELYGFKNKLSSNT